MNDRRVMRGNTYAARVILPSAEAPQQRLKTTRFANTRLYDNRNKKHRSGRRAEDEVIEEKASHEYLEELTNIPLAEDSSSHANQLEMDELEEVQYVPKAPGADVATWIDELEMFDFNESVEPILEVLIGKSMDQGLREVRQEEEIKVLSAHQAKWALERDIIQTEAQRLLVEAQRKKEEADRRLAQAKEARREEAIAEHTQCAKTTAKEFFTELQTRVLQNLATAGHFYDPVFAQVDHTFMPWLVKKVEDHLNETRDAEAAMDKLISNAVAKGAAERDEVLRQRRVLAERLRKEEEERLRLAEEKRKAEEEEEARLKALAEAKAAEEAAAGDEEDEEDY